MAWIERPFALGRDMMLRAARASRKMMEVAADLLRRGLDPVFRWPLEFGQNRAPDPCAARPRPYPTSFRMNSAFLLASATVSREGLEVSRTIQPW